MKKLPLIVFFFFLFGMSYGQQKYDTVKVMLLVNDTLGIAWVQPVYGYSVREKHNTSEGVTDPGGQICIDKSGKWISCYEDYFKHIKYLDGNKKPFRKSVIIWQSKEL